MKNITMHGDWKDSATLIDSITQNCNQFDNFGCYIYQLADGRNILWEDQINESAYYLLEESDSLLAETYAHEWARNIDSYVGSDYRTEMIAWGLTCGSDYAVSGDFKGECSIIKVGNFYGYSHVEILSSYEIDGGNNKNHIFASREEAQEWINAQDEEIYYTSHNEAGRPVYYIVEA